MSNVECVGGFAQVGRIEARDGAARNGKGLTVAPVDIHSDASCARHVVGRSGDEQHSIRREAEGVQARLIGLRLDLIPACAFRTHNYVKFAARCYGSEFGQLLQAVGHDHDGQSSGPTIPQGAGLDLDQVQKNSLPKERARIAVSRTGSESKDSGRLLCLQHGDAIATDRRSHPAEANHLYRGLDRR